MHHKDASKTHGEKARWVLYKNAMCCFEQILEITPHEMAAIQPLTSYLKKQPRRTRHVKHKRKSKD